jgi:hypothetical protein
MIRIIMLRVGLSLLVFHLSACGGGGSSSKPPLNFTGSTSSTSSATANAQVSSIALSASGTYSSITSLQNSSESASSTAPYISALIFPVNNKKVVMPGIHTSIPPETIQVNEMIQLSWVAYAEEGILNNVTWSQISGPTVTLLSDEHLLKITAGQVGDVVVEGAVTDAKGNTTSVKVNFTVVAPFSTKAKLLLGNSSGNGIDLVIVGDGFLAQDQQKLETAALNAMHALLAYDSATLAHYQLFFNVWLVESISTTRTISGDTLFGAYFHCNGLERLLCVDDSKVLSSVVAAVPQYDQVLVLVNSETYGGAGGQVATASLHVAANNIAIHELGHSLVYLADEYSEKDTSLPAVEPFERNITINPDPKNVKWNYWFENSESIVGVNIFSFDENKVGYFEGGYYREKGVWRPTYNSIMRSLGGPFGSVNAEAWALTLWHYYSATSDFLPQTDTPIVHDDLPAVFAAVLPLTGNNVRISWWVNDVSVAGSAPHLILSALDDSIRSVKVVVEDATLLIRRDPGNYSRHEHTWTIQ